MGILNKKKDIIRAILTQAYLDNMEYYAKLFIKAKQTIDHLEGEEFAAAWGEMKWEYQRKCADDAIKMLTQMFPESADCATKYYQTREVPNLVGQTEYLIQYMSPDYTFCVLYYIFTGKKHSNTIHLYGAKTEAEIIMMMKTWTRMWESNYNNHEALYMGTNRPQMDYEYK